MQSPTAAPLTVLVAEDNEINRFFIVRLLRQQGHQVMEALDGQQALCLLDQHHFDLALLDIQMPHADGIEVLQRIRRLDDEQHRHTPVIALTAYAMLGDREKFLQSGFDSYLAKPIQPGDLEAAIDAVLHPPSTP